MDNHFTTSSPSLLRILTRSSLYSEGINSRLAIFRLGISSKSETKGGKGLLTLHGSSMNAIRQIHVLNQRELEAAVAPKASWHADYRDTAYIYVGGLPYDLSEGDILTIFSQFGEPVHLNLVRDKETGKSRGFAFLKYEDQRSTDLAVDNLTGATVLGRVLKVDHVRYKRSEDEGTGNNLLTMDENVSSGERSRSMSIDSTSTAVSARRRNDYVHTRQLQEKRELHDIENHDDEDPMKQYIIDQKKEELNQALQKSISDGDEDIILSSRHAHSRHRRHRHHKDVDRDSDVVHRYAGHRARRHQDKDRHRPERHSPRRHRRQHSHSQRDRIAEHGRYYEGRYAAREHDQRQCERQEKHSRSPEPITRRKDRYL